jgi:catechol 2,3-dioxygenase-like lactoylglutathione lyase family enzyme
MQIDHVSIPVADLAAARAFYEQALGARGAFHEAALAAGGTDNGAPGLRDYVPNYYAAYVRDPEGNNIEAVCRTA